MAEKGGLRADPCAPFESIVGRLGCAEPRSVSGAIIYNQFNHLQEE